MGRIGKTLALLLTLIIATSSLTILTINPANAQTVEYITIKADGSIEPANAPIQRKGNLYTVTDNIQQYLVLERNYTTLDGGGHHIGGVFGPLLVQSDYTYTADGVTNITVTNLTIDGQGIIFFSVTYSVLSHITINNGSGIDVIGDGNQISDVIVNYGRGLSVSGKNNQVLYNHLTSCNYTLAENNPPPFGINIGGSNNIIKGNWIVGTNGSGINLGTSSNNIVYGNQIWENKIGIRTMTIYSQNKAENNIVYYNNFVANQENYHDEMIMTAPHSVTIWDFSTFGNYWGDYIGVDANGDGKGDTPYVIDENNQDHYPLMNPMYIDNISSIPTPSPTTQATPTPTVKPTTDPSANPNPTTQNSSPSPTVPELSWLAIIPLLLSVFAVTILVRHQKTAKLRK